MDALINLRKTGIFQWLFLFLFKSMFTYSNISVKYYRFFHINCTHLIKVLSKCLMFLWAIIMTTLLIFNENTYLNWTVGKTSRRVYKITYVFCTCIILKGEGKYFFQRGLTLIQIYIQKYIPKSSIYFFMSLISSWPRVKYIVILN